MVELPRSQRLNLPLAPLAAGILATVVAAFFALAPADLLGKLVLDSGIASLVRAAEPPLGITARAALIMIGAGGVGLVTWFGLYLVIGTRSIDLAGRGGTGDVPVLRRADAHPDAPARRPLFANSDLGTPFLDVRAPRHVDADAEIEEAVFTPVPPPAVAPQAVSPPAAPPPVAPPILPAERDIPLDLDMPMSVFDAGAIPVPSPPPSPPPPPPAQPRPQVFDDGERFETFDLTPLASPAPAPEPVADYDASASIHALLDRLEKRVGRTPPAKPREESLQESLASLRKLAMTR